MNELTTIIKIGEIQANLPELKKQLDLELERFNIVFTDETIPEAKKIRAELNKLKEKYETKRKNVKKEIMKTYDDFEKEYENFIAYLDSTVLKINNQVRDFENKQKEEKRLKLTAIWERLKWSEQISFNKIFKENWLNVSTSISSIEEQMQNTVDLISQEVLAISNLPGFNEKMLNIYFYTLSLTQCIEMSNVFSATIKPNDIFTKAIPPNFEYHHQSFDDIFSDFPSANKTYIVEVPEIIDDKFLIYCKINDIIVKEKR